MSEKISVIITTYQRAELLQRAVDSVLDQTYCNVEVLVVDDNDPDSQYRRATETLMRERYSGDNRVVYCQMPKNGGACAARNFGVSKSSGKYINFLDDDDEFLSTKLEKQIEVFENSSDRELSIVGCYAEVVNEHNEIINIEKRDIEGDVFFYQLCSNIISNPLALIRKDYYLESGGFETMFSSQEHWMFAKVYSLHSHYKFVPEVLVRIYHHSGMRISTNPNKPLGAIDLRNRVSSFYQRFNKKQIKIIECHQLDNIINAFLNQNRKKEAFPYLLKRQQYELFTLSNLKIVLRFILGTKLYGKLIHGR